MNGRAEAARDLRIAARRYVHAEQGPESAVELVVALCGLQDAARAFAAADPEVTR